MLLDELVATREHADEQLPPPVLAIDPVAVPPAADVGRRAARQRLVDLEQAARRNYRSAEEARRALFEEHQRLEQEASARVRAQGEAAALRRELDRLHSDSDKRAAQAKNRATRAAREEVAEDLERFQTEHTRVVDELRALQGTLRDHDGLLEEYAMQLREEQQARAALQVEVDRVEHARERAERAAEQAKQRADDELIKTATAKSELADVKSDRDRLAGQIVDFTTGDGPVARLQADIEERDAEIAHLHQTIAMFEARAEDLVAQHEATVEAADAERAAAEARVAEAEAAQERARADGDRLRAHASALGDELAALRAQVAELQAAAPAPVHEREPVAPVPEPEPAPEPDRPPLARREKRASRAAPPPLPVRRPEPERFVEEPVAAPAEPELEPEPALVAAGAALEGDLLPSRGKPEADGVRRTAMAELAGIASTNPDDDFTYRRR